MAGAEIIDIEKQNFYTADTFFNMNRKEDYEKILELFIPEAK
jgi:molybdopterin-guanine dinucleotide biosynthesis protein A